MHCIAVAVLVLPLLAAASILFGGTVENVALAFKSAGRENCFYWYVTGIGTILLVTALLMNDSRKFNALGDAEV